MSFRIRGLIVSVAVGLGCVLSSAQIRGQNAYITNATSNNVSVINTATDAVIATIPVGNSPFGVAVSPDGRRVYIANNGSETVSVIDTATNKVTATIGTRGSVGIAVSPDDGRVYAANLNDQSLSVIDTETNTVIATVPVGVLPYGVVVAEKKVYVTNCTAQCSSSSPGTVTVLDATTDKVITTIPVAPTTNAPGLAASPDGRKVYVTNETSDNVPVIDTATDTVIATIPVGDSTSAAVSPDGTKVYIPNRGNHVAHRQCDRSRSGLARARRPPSNARYVSVTAGTAAAPVVKRLRSERPEPEFTVSMRTHWNGKDEGELRERVAAFGKVGVQHIMVHPVNRDIDDWDEVIEGVGRVAARAS